MNWPVLLGSAITIGAAWTVWGVARSRWLYDMHKIPGPKAWPLAGNLHNIVGNAHLHKVLKGRVHAYASISISISNPQSSTFWRNQLLTESCRRQKLNLSYRHALQLCQNLQSLLQLHLARLTCSFVDLPPAPSGSSQLGEAIWTGCQVVPHLSCLSQIQRRW